MVDIPPSILIAKSFEDPVHPTGFTICLLSYMRSFWFCLDV